MEPSAIDITVIQVLDLLDNKFDGLSKGIANGSYTFWLGSGISRDKVADLSGVVRQVLEFIHSKIDPSDDDCKFRRAIEDCISCAQLSDDQKRDLDLAQAVGDWHLLPEILDRLTRAYSKFLDVRIVGELPDYLLWDAAKFVETFSNAEAEPDCEHLCIAILMMEGLLENVASANWDGLIEAAVSELSEAPERTLQVCVSRADFRAVSAHSTLLKFHGCAILAAKSPATHRELLIGRESQITGWPHNHSYKVMKARLIELATIRPTLMMGLSAQDSNIKAVFAEAEATMEWEWPSSPPAHVFSENNLGAEQKALLKNVYGKSYDDHGPEIELASLLRAYAKPLLSALVLHVLAQKVEEHLKMAVGLSMTDEDFQALKQGIRKIRDKVALCAEPDRLNFIRNVIVTMTWFLTSFQLGKSSEVTRKYKPINSLKTHLIAGDASIETNGIRELSVALAILGNGDSVDWQLDLVKSGDLNSIHLKSPLGTKDVFFAANQRAAFQLEQDGSLDRENVTSIIIHSTTPVTRMPRSPRSRPGRTGETLQLHVDMTELIANSTNAKDIHDQFRESAML